MNAAPHLPGSRPGSAAEIERALEQPLNTISADKSQALARLRRQRHVEQIHRLGARAVFELVDELDRVGQQDRDEPSLGSTMSDNVPDERRLSDLLSIRRPGVLEPF